MDQKTMRHGNEVSHGGKLKGIITQLCHFSSAMKFSSHFRVIVVEHLGSLGGYHDDTMTPYEWQIQI